MSGIKGVEFEMATNAADEEAIVFLLGKEIDLIVWEGLFLRREEVLVKPMADGVLVTGLGTGFAGGFFAGHWLLNGHNPAFGGIFDMLCPYRFTIISTIG